MRGIPFTGCGAPGLMFCKHKGISKKILGYHRIHTPAFVTIGRGQRISRPRHLKFPILVKPLKEEASLGISQASLVETDEQFKERVEFIHEKWFNDVIAEEYIHGRELYVSIIGNHRLKVFPIRELVFKEVPPDEPKIATYKAKWDEDYRKRWGLQNQFAKGLDAAVVADIERTCKRIYRLLTIDGYARLDLRLTPENKLYFIEANPNPILAADEDFAQSAMKADLTYPELIAHRMSVPEIQEFLGVDSLAYLSLDRLVAAIGTPGAGFCTACMTGEYPTAVDVQQAKDVLERVPSRG